MILVFLILINGMIMLSCSQDKVKFENVEVEIKGNHCIGTFDTPYLFKVTFDADIDLPVLPEYRSIPVRKVSLTIGEIKRLISICSDSNSVDLFGQWDLSKQELMAMLKQAEPYMGTEKVSPDYIAWLKNSIDSASEIPIRRQINLNDIPSGIPVIVYGKDNSNNPPSLLYFVIDGDFLFWYQRKEFIEIIPESMTAKHQYDPNYETEEQFIRKKPDAPSISQDNAYGYYPHGGYSHFRPSPQVGVGRCHSLYPKGRLSFGGGLIDEVAHKTDADNNTDRYSFHQY